MLNGILKEFSIAITTLYYTHIMNVVIIIVNMP